MQKDWISLRRSKASAVTGVCDREIHAMAIEIRCSKTLVMEFNHKNSDCVDTWSSYNAWHFFQNFLGSVIFLMLPSSKVVELETSYWPPMMSHETQSLTDEWMARK